MIQITFNTKTRALRVQYDSSNIKDYSNVMTIKEFDGFYEARQRQESNDRNAPILRVPISQTIIEYTHE